MYYNKETVLSVIIPHRNIPDLLRRCLESIPVREDVQIIVVDDCSDEHVSRIIAEFCKTKQIEEYKTPSPTGGGAARNIGLLYAKGKWITFIDADDFFTSKFNSIINTLLTLPEDVDILYCAANSLDSEFFTSSDRANTLNKYIALYQQKDYEGEQRLRFTFGEPWCKIVRRELIEKYQISFTESTIHNDTRYSYLVGYYARHIVAVPYALCTITTRNGSVSKSITEAKKLERITIFAEAHKFFIEHGIPTRYLINFLWPQMARSLLENKATFRQGYSILKENGFSSSKIWMNTIKHIVRNRIVKEGKKLLGRIG